MASQYSTLALNSFFDSLLALLIVGGLPTLKLLSSTEQEVAIFEFENVTVKSRTDSVISLAAPPTTMALLDATVTHAVLLNGAGGLIVTLDVGSPTSNPDAELLLNSNALYAGGSVTLTAVTISA